MGCLLLLVLNIGVHYSWALVEPSAKGVHAVIGLGVAGLNFFLGVALFLFSVTSFFLTFGLVSESRGLNWLPGAWNWNWSHLTFHPQKSLHFLYDSGMQMKPHAPGCTFDQLGCPVSSKNMPSPALM